ncbi:hypothetical protein [Dinghuibacter silviterrae]|uniref:Fasciclin domain-containing protein n=1 Tax=Dinghuibacter silviterrae TaxID=1539049 RepID=A0A4V6Q9U9_9BACT|nr:hypothetical protein [Dinghuibacter silviterrae]TDW96052.1 hypothetical protein EDB95_3874 [Dinghuibacter silviterrae]
MRYLLIISIALLALSCNKNYLTDGGTSKANTSLSTYDYLAGNTYHYFDTVLLIADHFGLKDSMNMSGTFFAPTDFSINALMNTLNITTLDSLYNHITSKFLTQYMLSQKGLNVTTATVAPEAFPNWADTICAVKKTAFTETVANSAFNYYILQYVKINGQMDGVNGPVAGDPADVVLNCQTEGIQTSTGTTLNVLANNASLAIR